MDEKNIENNFFEIDGHTIEYNTWVLDLIKQDLINLDDTNKEFITYSLVDADILLKQLDSEANISSYSAKDLDNLIDLWRNKRTNFKYVEEQEFVNAIGAAFGNLLNTTYNLKWTIVSDEYGTDFACIREKPLLQAFPFDSVWKSVEKDRENSLQAIVDLIRKNFTVE